LLQDALQAFSVPELKKLSKADWAAFFGLELGHKVYFDIHPGLSELLLSFIHTLA